MTRVYIKFVDIFSLRKVKNLRNLFSALEVFIELKVALACGGKYLKNSGVENVFIETELFGHYVVEQLFDAINYARTLAAFNYWAEALRRLQFKAFFTQGRMEKYENQLIDIKLLQESFQTKNTEECRHIFDELKEACTEILNDFQVWVDERCAESEMFCYHNNFLIIVNLIHDLIRADRTGDFELHVSSLKTLQPLLHIMDRTNYLKWCLVYVEEMLSLLETAPEVYEQMFKGRFTTKRSDVPFTSVPNDQELEMTTIQRVLIFLSVSPERKKPLPFGILLSTISWQLSIISKVLLSLITVAKNYKITMNFQKQQLPIPKWPYKRFFVI